MVSTTPWISRSGLSAVRTRSIGAQKLRETFEREELALQRHEHGVGRDHRIDRHGRAATAGNRSAPCRRRRRSRLEVSKASREPEILFGSSCSSVSTPARFSSPGTRSRCGTFVRDDRIGERALAHQHVVRCRTPRRRLDAETGRGVALRVAIHHEHAAAHRCQGGAEIDGGSGLTYPTFWLATAITRIKPSGDAKPKSATRALLGSTGFRGRTCRKSQAARPRPVRRPCPYLSSAGPYRKV